jgi:hypothetical protein
MQKRNLVTVVAIILFVTLYKNATAQLTLDVGLVKSMINTYRGNQLKVINASGKRELSDDAHSVWFSLNTLKLFIQAIESNVANIDATKANSLGIRIYYTAYPVSTTWGVIPAFSEIKDFAADDKRKQYGKMHTVLMIPTIEQGGVNYDFDPSVDSTYNSLTAYKNLVGPLIPVRRKFDDAQKVTMAKQPNVIANVPEKIINGQNDPSIKSAATQQSQPAQSNNKRIMALGVPLKNNNTMLRVSVSGVAAQNHGDLVPPNGITGEGFQ